MLVRLEELQIPSAFRGRPTEHDCNIVDDTGLAELLQAFLMVFDVDHAQHDPQKVFSLEVPDSGVDVLRMQAVILQTEKQRTCCGSEKIVRWNLSPFPRHLSDLLQHRVSLLTR